MRGTEDPNCSLCGRVVLCWLCWHGREKLSAMYVWIDLSSLTSWPGGLNQHMLVCMCVSPTWQHLWPHTQFSNVYKWTGHQMIHLCFSTSLTRIYKFSFTIVFFYIFVHDEFTCRSWKGLFKINCIFMRPHYTLQHKQNCFVWSGQFSLGWTKCQVHWPMWWH